MRPPSPQAYLETQVRTASPLQLVLMLYDGCLKFCQMALDTFDDTENLEPCHNSIVKAQRIVIELACALDSSANKEVSGNLGSLYSYMYSLLVTANVERKKENITEVMTLMRTLRSAWADADGQRAPTGTDANVTGPGLSIQG